MFTRRTVRCVVWSHLVHPPRVTYLARKFQIKPADQKEQATWRVTRHTQGSHVSEASLDIWAIPDRWGRAQGLAR